MSTISRPLASMRRMISPTSLRRTPSPFTNTSVCSILLLHLNMHLLTDFGLTAALVCAAVRTRPPLHVERFVAIYARFLELPGARGADQVVSLDQVAAVGAQKDTVPKLALEHGQLQLAFARVFQVLGGAYDEVDQGAEVRKDEGDETPEDTHGPAPGGVRVGPVDERDPEYDEKQEHELARDPQDRALQEVGDDLERVRVLLECEQGSHPINFSITK